MSVPDVALPLPERKVYNPDFLALGRGRKQTNMLTYVATTTKINNLLIDKIKNLVK